MSEESVLKNREKRKSGNIWVGVGMIAMGVIFLVSNFTDLALLDNWWAFFILIPGVASLWRGYQEYQEDGSWSGRAGSALVGGMVTVFIAAIFLFGLDWGQMWPMFIIFGGIGYLLNHRG